MSDINEIETEARKNRALVVASGHVLIEHFPSDFGEWDEKALEVMKNQIPLRKLRVCVSKKKMSKNIFLQCFC